MAVVVVTVLVVYRRYLHTPRERKGKRRREDGGKTATGRRLKLSLRNPPARRDPKPESQSKLWRVPDHQADCGRLEHPDPSTRFVVDQEHEAPVGPARHVRGAGAGSALGERGAGQRRAGVLPPGGTGAARVLCFLRPTLVTCPLPPFSPPPGRDRWASVMPERGGRARTSKLATQTPRSAARTGPGSWPSRRPWCAAPRRS